MNDNDIITGIDPIEEQPEKLTPEPETPEEEPEGRYAYLHQSVPGRKAVFRHPLDPALFAIGESADDFYSAKWIPLSEEQEAWMGEHTHSTIREILTMEAAPEPPRTVGQAMAEKLAAIDRYDTSAAVNGFILAGQRIWLDKATRVGLANSIAIEEAAGRTQTTLWFGGVCYRLDIAMARRMLAAVELYALDCYNVTATHRYNVQQLATVEAIDGYDHTAGYPNQLNLDNQEI